jgi:hypothetical protein
MRRRAHLTVIAAVWLASQVAVFTATSLRACCDHDNVARADRHACCAGMQPGDACPMHRPGRAEGAGRASSPPPSHQHGDTSAEAPHGSSDMPALECACCAANTDLATLLFGHGILPPQFLLPYVPMTERIAAADGGAHVRAGRPDLPPPRA